MPGKVSEWRNIRGWPWKKKVAEELNAIKIFFTGKIMDDTDTLCCHWPIQFRLGSVLESVSEVGQFLYNQNSPFPGRKQERAETLGCWPLRTLFKKNTENSLSTCFAAQRFLPPFDLKAPLAGDLKTLQYTNVKSDAVSVIDRLPIYFLGHFCTGLTSKSGQRVS